MSNAGFMFAQYDKEGNSPLSNLYENNGDAGGGGVVDKKYEKIKDIRSGWPFTFTATPSFTIAYQADQVQPSGWVKPLADYTSLKFMDADGVMNPLIATSVPQEALVSTSYGGFNDGTVFKVVGLKFPVDPTIIPTNVNYEWVTDSPYFGMVFVGSAGGVLSVDSETVAFNITKSGAPRHSITIDHNGVRKMRKYRLTLRPSYGMGGFFCARNDVFVKSDSDSLRWSIDGDSITSNVTSSGLYGGITSCVPFLCGDMRTIIQAVGGTGYGKTNGSYPNAVTRLINNIQPWGEGETPDVQVVALGINDNKDISAKPFVDQWFSEFRKKCPDTLLVVLSPWSPNEAVKAQLLTSVAQYVSDAVSADSGKWIYINSLNGEWKTSWGKAGSIGREWISGTGWSYDLTAAPNAATSATLTTAFTRTSGAYTLQFNNGITKSVTLTDGSTAVSWTGAVTDTSAHVGIYSTAGSASLIVGPDGTHPDEIGGNYLAAMVIESIKAAIGSAF